MYVCLCNGLTDLDVQRAAAAGAVRTSDVYRACGGAADCGGCVRTVLQMLRECGAAGTEPAMVGDD